MANNLTGDYEAVLQVSVRQINGLLATLHQHGGEPPDKWPRFPHRSLGMRVGKEPKILDLGVVQYSKWLEDAVQALRGSGPSFSSSASPLEIGAHLAAKAPPGAAVRMHKALEDLDAARVEVVAPDTVRGLADVQISTPAISFVDGSTSEVTVHVYVRALYTPEKGTALLPEPIHGEVRVTYQLVPKRGKNVLEVQIPSDDSKIRFFPTKNSGLTQVQADNEIAVHIRQAVRRDFQPSPVDLGRDFKLFEFKAVGSSGNFRPAEYVDALGSGAGQALALPVQLSSDAEAPAGAINGVTNLFLGASDDFAIAVSLEYVKTKFAPTLDRLLGIRVDQVIEVPVGSNPTLHFWVTDADLQFKNGSMDLIMKARATTTDPLYHIDWHIGVVQRLTLALIGQSVSLLASDDDLDITGVPDTVFGQPAKKPAKKMLIAERNKALYNPPPPGEPPGKPINEALQKAAKQLSDALHSFDKSLDESFPRIPSASYTAVEVNPDGIIVRGAIETKYHYGPEMHIDYTGHGNFWTALNCWIRGGRIDQFTWTYVLLPPPPKIAWGIPSEHHTLPHSFTYPVPDVLKGNLVQFKQVCLTIEGTQVTANGDRVDVKGELASGTCSVSSHEPFLAVDPKSEAIFVALHMPEGPVGPDGLIEETITGHVNILAAHPLPPGGVSTNSLIHFAGARAERPLQALNRSLAQIRRRDFALTSVIVMPRGTFASNRRREVEEQLGLVEERSAEPALVTAATDAAAEQGGGNPENASAGH